MPHLRDLDLGRGRVLPASLLSVRFSRSGGPGGQHVNKVETKVDLRVALDAAAAILGEGAVARIRARLRHRLDADGNLQVVSNEHRQRARNLDAALARMEALLRGALLEPAHRRRTRPTAASKERRLRQKQQRGRLKKDRSARGDA